VVVVKARSLMTRGRAWPGPIRKADIGHGPDGVWHGAPTASGAVPRRRLARCPDGVWRGSVLLARRSRARSARWAARAEPG